MAFSLSDALACYPAGQLRTSKSKQWVFLDGDYAWKGPYTPGTRLDNVRNRSAIFTAWNTPCVVKMIDAVETPDGTFVRFPNLMIGYPLTIRSVTETFTGLTYQVVDNAPVTDVRAVLPAKDWIPAAAEDLLLALCHCFILGVGDMNLRNSMVDTVARKLYVIDFDDNLGADKLTETFYFNKPPAQKLEWYSRVRHHYPVVAQRLTPLLTDATVLQAGLQGRVQQTIDLLVQYGGAPPTLPQLTLRVLTNQGSMHWNGLRGGSTTFSGLKVDAAKSGVQKYIRRQMPFKALLAAHELYRFREVGGDAAVTNLYNRVAIIAAEDVGPAHLPLVLEVIRTVESKDRNVYRLLAMVQLLADSPKTRIMSHANYVYGTPEGRTAGLTAHVPIDCTFTPEEITYVQQQAQHPLFDATDPADIRPYILMFLRRLQAHDMNAFSWAFFYTTTVGNRVLTKRNKIASGRGMTGDASILLWRALAQVLPPQTHDILVNAYYKHTESRPFLQLAIVIAVYAVPYSSYDLTSTITMVQTETVYQRILKSEFPLVLDSFVLDKHTAEGRQAGKGTAEFVTDGALVIPQDIRYYREDLESLYKQRV